MLRDPFRFFAAIASVSLKIELEMDADTSDSINCFVILPSGSDFDACTSFSISLESCQRFGPTCAERKFASANPIWPPFSWTSFVIQVVVSCGLGSRNSSTFAIFESFL